MRQAILARAFSGTLVPAGAELARREGRGYGPAAVLLRRTRLEKKGGRRGGRPGTQ
ncbi:MAG: hypothetical protein BWX50_01033 [Euryarchaeota archaeon ADurb.Bin009]|nr:MAG: hypothetical protein BWX50_01033 [Euryarchaeota archaeon ADurb.Bin009]